jgi:hypothetical protein
MSKPRWTISEYEGPNGARVQLLSEELGDQWVLRKTGHPLNHYLFPTADAAMNAANKKPRKKGERE